MAQPSGSLAAATPQTAIYKHLPRQKLVKRPKWRVFRATVFE
jgi:hypothetical protein